MIKFRGRLGLRQYMPAKPTKYGIKVWVRADSHNGYINEFDVYVGLPQGNRPEVGLGRKVIERLSSRLEGKGHHGTVTITLVQLQDFRRDSLSRYTCVVP